MDNTSTISLAKNPVSHGRNKHIDVKYYFLHDTVNRDKIELKYYRTELQRADVFTKALNHNRFEFMRSKIGILALKDLN